MVYRAPGESIWVVSRSHSKMITDMKKILIPIVCAIFGVLLCSCEEQLTTSDATKVDSSTFTTSTAGLNQILTSAYKSFLMGGSESQTGASYQGVVGFMLLYDMMGSDVAVNKWYGASPEAMYCFEPSRTQAANGAINLWRAMYNVINKANIIIDAAPDAKGSDAERNVVVGTAKAMRGYCYFHLLMNYQQTYAIAKDKRGVILRLHPDDDPNMGFSTVGQCYDQVVEDLKDAEAKLAGFNRSEKWEIDATVAAGMLARVYQVMGNWSGAFAEAKKVYDKYGTLMSKDEWCSGMDHLMEDGCSELAWGCKFTNLSNISSNTVFNNWYNFDPSYGEGLNDGPMYHFLDVFVDDSYVKLFEGDDTDYRGTKCDKTENVTDEDEINVMFWHRTANALGNYVEKKWAYNKLKSYGDGTYEQHTNANHVYGISVPLMRGSEMLLIMAEAAAHESGLGNAQELLNRLQNARQVKNPTKASGADLLEAIYVERRKELLGEGFVGSYDLLRLQRPLVRYAACAANNYAGHFTWGMTELDGYNGADAQPKGTIPSNDYRFLYQIPQMEIANNEAVTSADQNPFKGQ